MNMESRTMNTAVGILLGSLLPALGIAASAQAVPGNPVAEPLTYNAGSGYYNPPSWNSMVMVNITFDGYTLGWESDSYDFTVGPILTVAPPNGSKSTFDPAQLWSVLNGTAFNRQLGWYDNVNDDFYEVHRNPDDYGFFGQPALPDAYSVWIEKLAASSAELKTYFVSESQVKYGPYTPIFGTDGSSTKWQWDGYMDHNANAVKLSDIKTSNQIFTGVYKLYIGDASGNEILKPDHITPLYGSTTITWKWIGPSIKPGDINLDGYVNVGDLQLLVVAWGSRLVDPANGNQPSQNWNARADLNTNGYINVGDLQVLIAHWGT